MISCISTWFRFWNWVPFALILTFLTWNLVIRIKGLLHDQTKFHKLLLKPEFVKPNPSVQCLSLRREGVRVSSNGARRDGIFLLRCICHGYGDNKVENDSKPMWSYCRSGAAVKVHFINQPIFNVPMFRILINRLFYNGQSNHFKIKFVYLESL